MNGVNVLDPVAESDLRARARLRGVTKTALAAAFAKLTSVSTGLISIPFTLQYLGDERFGLWLTIISLIAFLSFADLGIGNGLQSEVSTAQGRDDVRRVRQSISSAALMLSLVAVLVISAMIAAVSIVPWDAVFNVRSAQAATEAEPTVAAFVSCYALSIPLSIVQRTQVGLQRGYLANLWNSVGSVAALLSTMLAIALQAPLPVLVIAYAGAPLAVALANSLWFFGFRERELAPSLKLVDRGVMALLLRTGGLFLVLQVVGAVAFLSDNLIIAQILGPEAVQDYAVPEKLFAVVGLGIGMLLTPLWPAYGEAIARGDVDWVRTTLKRSILLAGGAALLGAGALVAFAPFILAIWVGEAVNPPFSLLIGLGLWKVLEAVGVAVAMFLNGMRVVFTQVVLAILAAVSAVTLKVVLVQEIGVAGAVWGTLIAYAGVILLPLFLLRGRLLRALHARSSLP